MMQALARAKNLRVSTLHSTILCKELRGKKLEKAKKLLENLIAKKTSVGGKYYTKAATLILKVLKQAEANAKQKGLEEARLFVAQAKADKGERFWRPRAVRRGRRGKSTHLEIVLEER